MGNPFFQGMDPVVAPDPVTPADSPGNPAGYDRVTPTGIGPAPYDISAPQDIAGITAAANAAMDLSGGQEGDGPGAGIPNRDSPRQQQAEAILMSPQGAGAMNVTAGFPDYENSDVSPGPNMETPIQGMGTYPGTMQDGVPQFLGGLGDTLPGVPPEGGNMGPGGMDYPGTTQDGLQQFG